MATLTENLYCGEWESNSFNFFPVLNLSQFAVSRGIKVPVLQLSYFRGKKGNKVIFYTSKDGRFFLYRIPK